MSTNSSPSSNCTLDTCPLSEAYLNYDPSLAANALYLSIFGLFLAIQCIQGYYFRTWTYTIGMVVGLIGEVVGYIARVQMHFNPFLANPFLMYLICLTIAPVFFSAAIYLCLSRIVVIYGIEHSRFRPRTYTIVFMTCDFISLVLQSVGGAIADLNLTNMSQQQMGVNIMIAGLASQVFSLLLFAALCMEYAWRVKKHSSHLSKHRHLTERKQFQWFLYALAFATLCIITRSSYRLAELQGGFGSSLANNEVLLMIFDGAMMTLTALALTAFHAGLVLGGNWSVVASEMKDNEAFSSYNEIGEELGEIRNQDIGAKMEPSQ